MKKLNDKLTFLLILILFSSCLENEIKKIKILEIENGIICKTGKVINHESSKIIGPSGGILQSSDKFFTLEFPEGSLPSDQIISIEKIQNTNPSGIGPGYRISPSKIKLQSPAIISFNYLNQDINSFPEALLITRQDKEGVWKAIGGTTLNKTTNIISLKTYIFGDWTLCEAFKFSKTIIALPGDEIQLFAEQFILADSFPVTIPFGEEIPIIKFETDNFKSWNLEGEGSFLEKENKLYYKAPVKIPEKNPVYVKTLVTSGFTLTSEIIIAQKGLTFRINDGSWNMAPSPVAETMAGIHQISGPLQNELIEAGEINIFWNLENGNMSWKQDIPQFKLIKNNLQFFHYYLTDDIPGISPGYLKIFKHSQNSKFVSGSFLLEKSGIYDMCIIEGNPYTGTAKIEGHFIIERKNYKNNYMNILLRRK